jgi:hypothetical protein
MKIKDILLELASRFGVDQFECDENEVCHLMVNDDLLIHLEELEEDDEFVLYSKVGDIPDDEKEASKLNKALLKDNLYGKKTDGACFALDPSSQSVILSKRFDQETIEFQVFVNHLEKFIAYATVWREKLERGTGGSSDSDKGKPSSSPPPTGYIKV